MIRRFFESDPIFAAYWIGVAVGVIATMGGMEGAAGAESNGPCRCLVSAGQLRPDDVLLCAGPTHVSQMFSSLSQRQDELAQLSLASLKEDSQLGIDAFRHGRAGCPAPHRAVGDRKIAGDLGLPARPVQSLAAAVEESAGVERHLRLLPRIQVLLDFGRRDAAIGHPEFDLPGLQRGIAAVAVPCAAGAVAAENAEPARLLGVDYTRDTAGRGGDLGHLGLSHLRRGRSPSALCPKHRTDRCKDQITKCYRDVLGNGGGASQQPVFDLHANLAQSIPQNISPETHTRDSNGTVIDK